MTLLHTLPAEDGFSMPAEFAPQQGVMLIWPMRPGSWGRDASAAQRAFCEVIRAASRSEAVYLLADSAHFAQAKAAAGQYATVLQIESDDAWARDVGPTFVSDGQTVRGVSWRFNAWGGGVDGLYAHWDKDDAVAAAFCDALGCDCYDAGCFVLEGGAVHSDGEGTLLVTESCLCSAGRNPNMSKAQIEDTLKAYLGAHKVLWLPRGIYHDETNEHVDNVCAFIAPGEVVLAWTDNRDDPQYALSAANLAYLENEIDAKGRRIAVHKLPIPDVPVCVSEADCEAYAFEEGEDVREPGERLAASYVNFAFTNGAVLLPQFGGENAVSDARAAETMARLCPEREIIRIDARAILLGGGNIHCITQQIPKGAFHA